MTNKRRLSDFRKWDPIGATKGAHESINRE